MKLWRPPWTCCFVRDLLTSRLSTGEHRAKDGERRVSDYDDTWAPEGNLTLSLCWRTGCSLTEKLTLSCYLPNIRDLWLFEDCLCRFLSFLPNSCLTADGLFHSKIFGIGNVNEGYIVAWRLCSRISKMNKINEKINFLKIPKYFSKVLCPCYQNSLSALSYWLSKSADLCWRYQDHSSKFFYFICFILKSAGLKSGECPGYKSKHFFLI